MLQKLNNKLIVSVVTVMRQPKLNLTAKKTQTNSVI